jgi:hypothetical protein
MRGEEGLSPKHMRRRVQSMNDLPSCADVREACQVRKKELAAIRENQRRRSEKIQLLLSGDEKLKSHTFPRRCHSVKDFTSSITSDSTHASNERSTSSAFILPNHNDQATCKPDGDQKQGDVMKSGYTKRYGDLRVSIEQKKQQRLQLMRSMTAEGLEGGLSDDLKNVKIFEEHSEDVEEDCTLFF